MNPYRNPAGHPRRPRSPLTLPSPIDDTPGGGYLALLVIAALTGTASAALILLVWTLARSLD